MLLAVAIVMDNATEETAAATEPQSGVRIAGEADLKLAEEIFAKITRSRTNAELEEAIKEEMKLLEEAEKRLAEAKAKLRAKEEEEANEQSV